MSVRMAGAEHPLIAAHGADAFSHLVGQRLKREPMVSGGEGAADAIVHAVAIKHSEKLGNRFGKTALQQIFVAIEWHKAFRVHALFQRHMKTMNRVEEKKRA